MMIPALVPLTPACHEPSRLAMRPCRSYVAVASPRYQTLPASSSAYQSRVDSATVPSARRSVPRAQHRDTLAGEIVEICSAAGRCQQQRQHRAARLRSGAVGPVGVGGPQGDAFDAPLGADEGIRTFVEVEHLAHGVRRMDMPDAERAPDVFSVDDRLAQPRRIWARRV